MRLKLDENLGPLAANLLRRSGHDVETVPSENMRSAPDRVLLESCRRERRCLITLDLDFGNPLLFRPTAYPGIAVLRMPPKPSHDDLLACVATLNNALAAGAIAGKLWVVQRGRVREYQDPYAEV
jgi:predicted nuclease of predicted toxin-antitoxin system